MILRCLENAIGQWQAIQFAVDNSPIILFVPSSRLTIRQCNFNFIVLMNYGFQDYNVNNTLVEDHKLIFKSTIEIKKHAMLQI